MIIVNRTNDTITGSYNNIQFGLNYNEATFNKMKDLENKANEAKSYDELKKIYEEFEPLTVEDLSTTIESINPNIHIKKATGEYFLKNNGVVSSIAMPKELVDRIKESMDKGIDFTPLVKCWVRWLRNPKLRKLTKEGQKAFSQKFFNFINIKYTNHELAKKLMIEKGYSQDVADQMATTYSMKISNEGMLVGFKVSKEITRRFKLDDKGNKVEYDVYQGAKSIDEITGLITYEKNELSNEDRVFEPAVQGISGDAFMCSKVNKLGHIIKVGAIHSITWNQINTDDNTSCVPGLHVGGLDYIRGYQNGNTCTHNIFIDPSHIGAIPCDAKGAIRCIQYFVKDEFSGVNGSIYHSSTYASQVDSEWSKQRDEVIAAFNKIQSDKQSEIQAEIGEIKSI